MQKAEACVVVQSPPRINNLVDVVCPVHGKWIGHYVYGSVGIYYCYCKLCKKEVEVLMKL